jgi:cellulose synthase/poly-beta-1,6-N-acetylglucosamine synthase-like glycosyltransferase
VENALDADPIQISEVLVGLDAPTDCTYDILSQIHSDRLRIFRFSSRRGKLAVLRDLAEQTSVEVLVLTDAETNFAPNCVQRLVRHFADPRVGVAGGELRIIEPDGRTPVEGFYWRYELILKFLENRLNCVQGAVGAVYAVRRTLFLKQKASFAEDFQLPMEIQHAGYRMVYDPEATAIESAAPTFAAEFRRRVRLGAADYQILLHNPRFLNPLKGMLTFAYVSHKVFRWLGPLFLLGALLASICLVSSRIYFWLCLCQLVFYGAAAFGYWRKSRNESAGIFSLPLYFSAMNLALLFGLMRYASGRQKMAWDVTPRSSVKIGGISNAEEVSKVNTMNER